MPFAIVYHTGEAAVVDVPRPALSPVVHAAPPPGAPGASPAPYALPGVSSPATSTHAPGTATRSLRLTPTSSELFNSLYGRCDSPVTRALPAQAARRVAVIRSGTRHRAAVTGSGGCRPTRGEVPVT